MRLHDRNGANLFDLDLIFGQHEICKDKVSGTQKRKIALIGNSATFGLKVAAEKTFAGQLNQHWDSQGDRLHIYNFGFVTAYAFKDALIARKAIEYEPDLLLVAVSLADFVHTAPIPWPDTLPKFFGANNESVDRLSVEGAPGLEEIVETYAAKNQNRSWLERRWVAWRERGGYVRLAARHGAPGLVNRFLLSEGDGEVRPVVAPRAFPQAGPKYRCEKVLNIFNTMFGSRWTTWNILAYLEELERVHGVNVVVVDTPIEHNPIGACYNARHPSEAVHQYHAWLREQTDARGLVLWDLHDLLPRDQFSDSIHPTAKGHQTIASALSNRIKSHLRARSASLRTSATTGVRGEAGDRDPKGDRVPIGVRHPTRDASG